MTKRAGWVNVFDNVFHDNYKRWCLQEKVTKMVSVVSNIQERIPALERSHREMQQSLEHIMKTLQELNGKMTMK